MIEPAAAVQVGLVAALRADPALQAAMGGKVRVYDVVPAGAPFPYLVVGDDLVLPDDAEGVDGGLVTLTVHIWSRTDPPGQAEAKALAAAVAGLMAPPEESGRPLPTVAGFEVVIATLERSSHLTDPDRLTAHSIVTVSWTVEPL